MNNLTDPIFSKITNEYLLPLHLTEQINQIVNGEDYLDWQTSVNFIIDNTNNTGIDKTNKVLKL